jgi:hypothetical protein
MYNNVERRTDMIKWINVKAKNGVATLYSNNITLNTTAMYPFDLAYKVQVGIDDNNNIVIQPLSEAIVESGDLDESCLLKLERHKSFARISSVSLMKQLSEELGIELSKNPVQFETSWDSVENILTIHVKGAKK